MKHAQIMQRYTVIWGWGEQMRQVLDEFAEFIFRLYGTSFCPSYPSLNRNIRRKPIETQERLLTAFSVQSIESVMTFGICVCERFESVQYNVPGNCGGHIRNFTSYKQKSFI